MKAGIFIFVALVLPVAGAQAPVDHPAGRVRGVVIDSVSHRSLRRAMVTIDKVQTLNGETTLATDVAGTFEFTGLKPDSYHLTVVRDGYPARKTANVNAADDPASVTIELDPPAAISGRVLDEDGDGLPGCSVNLQAVKLPAGADIEMRQDNTVLPLIFSARSSGERGDYRVFNVLPGKYTAEARCDAPGFQPRPLSAGPDPPPSRAWVRQFYPAAPDASSAEQMELAPGAERTAVDFRMRTARVTQVRGTLSMPSGFPRGEGFTMMILIPADGQPADSLRPRPASGGASGTPFEFSHVFPGSYELLAFSIDLQAQDRAGIVQHVEVKDRPVNLAVALSRGLDIGGIVEVESGQNRDQIKLDKTSVRLSTSYPDIDQANAPVNPDGTFTIKSVIPAQWHIGFSSDSVYVKSVWLGTREVPRGLVDLTLNATGAPDKLRILVSAKTATIRGTAPPEADITWSALDGPVPSRNIARADASGQFTIRGLGPGKYRLAILPDEEGGSEITVNEGETASIALKAGNAIR